MGKQGESREEAEERVSYQLLDDEAESKDMYSSRGIVIYKADVLVQQSAIAKGSRFVQGRPRLVIHAPYAARGSRSSKVFHKVSPHRPHPGSFAEDVHGRGEE